MKIIGIIKNCVLFIIFLILVTGYNNVDSTQLNSNITTRNSNFPPIGWSEDIGISDLTNDYSCQFPNIAVNGSFVHVLWDANLNSTSDFKGLCYRRSVDNGNTWDNITYLTYPYGSGNNDIAVSGSNVHVIFTSYMPELDGIRYVRSTDNGNTWGSINSNLTSLAGTNLNIITNNNIIHIVFSYKNTSKNVWRIIYLRSFDNGDSWEKPRYLLEGNGTTNYLRPKLAVSEDYVYIVLWGINDTIELLRSQNNGDIWEHKIIFEGPDVGWPDLATSGNNIGVIWMDTSVPNSQLVFVKSNDNGKMWSKPKKINDPDPYIGTFNPRMVMINNTIHLTWEDYRNSFETRKIHSETYYKKSTDTGDTWTNDIRLTNKSENSWEPSISAYGNNVYVVWGDRRDKQWQIYFKCTIPDYTIEDVQVPFDVYANSTVELELTVNNIGYADGYMVPITIINSDQILYNSTINQFDINDRKKIKLKLRPERNGLYSLELFIDMYNNLMEWNESNNYYVINITVQNNSAPTAILNMSLKESRTIMFDATRSYDIDGSIVAYYFNYGDGNNSGWINNSTSTYKYNNSGKFLADLKIKDDRGAENLNKAKQLIIIESIDMPPIINNVTIHPSNPFPTDDVTISVDASDPNLDSLNYFYEVENGSITGTGPDVSWRSPDLPGEYQININVFDGLFYSTPWILVVNVIENQPPIIQNIIFNKSIIEPGEYVHFVINASDPDGHTIQYDCGPNEGDITSEGANITWHSPNNPGIYIITVNVSDNYGGYEIDKLFFVVGDPDPSVLIKFFYISPEKVYRGESSEILITLEIYPKYIGLISEISVDLSDLAGIPAQLLNDLGTDGDAVENDGIYSYKANIRIDGFTGEHEIHAKLMTIIPDYELTTSTTLTIDNKPVEETSNFQQLYFGSTIVLLLIVGIIVFLFSRKRRKRSNNSEKKENN